jgi:hypothetical protein
MQGSNDVTNSVGLLGTAAALGVVGQADAETSAGLQGGVGASSGLACAVPPPVLQWTPQLLQGCLLQVPGVQPGCTALVSTKLDIVVMMNCLCFLVYSITAGLAVGAQHGTPCMCCIAKVPHASVAFCYSNITITVGRSVSLRPSQPLQAPQHVVSMI